MEEWAFWDICREAVERLDKKTYPEPQAVNTVLKCPELRGPRGINGEFWWGFRRQEFDHRSTHNYKTISIASFKFD